MILGDTDHITVTGILPNTATEARTDGLAMIAGLLLGAIAVAIGRARLEPRRA